MLHIYLFSSEYFSPLLCELPKLWHLINILWLNFKSVSSTSKYQLYWNRFEAIFILETLVRMTHLQNAYLLLTLHTSPFEYKLLRFVNIELINFWAAIFRTSSIWLKIKLLWRWENLNFASCIPNYFWVIP